jgi:hypothetical protein
VTAGQVRADSIELVVPPAPKSFDF